MLRAVANIMIGRADAALKDLSNPFVGNQHDAPLWRALALARLGKWAEAREGFRESEAALATLPLEMQRVMLKDAIRAFIEVGDVTGAVGQLNEFEMVGVPRELAPAISVLSGRVAEGLGRIDDALRNYRAATVSLDRPAAAQGRLREIRLQHGRGNLKRADAINDLETLTTTWRGDETEAEALQLLARLYTEDGRFRDAFHVMRTALKAYPNAELTRRIQEESMTSFEGLFLAGKGDALPAIEALALFYDFRELTPIGRRGDEMIRRLADRLVAVDLLYQASELLQHQVDHRLQGAARAQVAAQLAVIYMMDRRPDRALATLRATRVSQLSNDLRNQRLLLEARALSDTGRHDVALEVIANVPGRETIRLRSDILWAARQYAQAAEQIELLHGERWREFAPLTDSERSDILRAAIGYVLGEDGLGLTRFRDKYAIKMSEGPDQRAFHVITAPVGIVGHRVPRDRPLDRVDRLRWRRSCASCARAIPRPARCPPRAGSRGPQQRRRLRRRRGRDSRGHAALADFGLWCNVPRSTGTHAMANLKTIRTDVVGSLLRPLGLREERIRFDEGDLSAQALRKIEDAAVRGAVELQEDAGPRRDYRRRDAAAQFPGQFRCGGGRLRRRALDGEEQRAPGRRRGAGPALGHQRDAQRRHCDLAPAAGEGEA